MPLAVEPSFVASLAQALNQAEVPCVVWGHCLLNLHGVPSIISGADYVIPDDCLETGAAALAQCHGLVPCRDPVSCLISAKDRPTPAPTFHLHLDGNENLTAGLYLQSETLWFLPPLDRALLFPNETADLPPYFALSSDAAVFPPWRPGRGTGVFTSAEDKVVAPRSHILLEAYMRLYARDQGKPAGTFGVSMICYMEGYVDEDGLLDDNLLPEPLKSSYRDLKGGRPTRPWMLELKAALGVAGEQESVSDDSGLECH